MTDEIEVIHTRVFAVGAQGGNQCPVVRHADGLSETEMRGVARHFGLDSAFLLKPHAAGAALRIRYFVPAREMGISGHATIAALTVAIADPIARGSSERAGRICVETTSGLFEVSWHERNQQHVMTLEQNAPVFSSLVSVDDVAEVLNIRTSDIAPDLPVQCVSVSRPKLLIPLRSVQVLDSLSPNFQALWSLCDREHVTGLYAFSRQTDKAEADVEARQFPNRAGFDEDAATGVAAAALAAYLVRHEVAELTAYREYRVAQGYAMGAPSLIDTLVKRYDGHIVRVAIRGTAEIVDRTLLARARVRQ